MITLYGITQSRAFRPLWMLHELGLPYEHVRLDFHGDDLKQDDYRALNPNGRVALFCGIWRGVLVWILRMAGDT